MFAVRATILSAVLFSGCIHPPPEVFPTPLAFTNCHARSSQKFSSAILVAKLFFAFSLCADRITKLTFCCHRSLLALGTNLRFSCDAKPVAFYAQPCISSSCIFLNTFRGTPPTVLAFRLRCKPLECFAAYFANDGFLFHHVTLTPPDTPLPPSVCRCQSVSGDPASSQERRLSHRPVSQRTCPNTPPPYRPPPR